MSGAMEVGLGGMLAQNNRIQSISNNIANLNTTGYKSNRVTFMDHMSRELNAGGASQIGQGVQNGGTATDWKSGSLNETGKTGNLAVQGEGFIPVKKNSGGPTLYTRAGDFSLTQNPENSSQYVFMKPGGSMLATDASGMVTLPAGSNDVRVENTGEVSAVNPDGERQSFGEVKLRRFANPDALTRAGGGVYGSPSGGWQKAAPMDFAAPGENGNGMLKQGYVEESNVKMVEEFSDMIEAQQAYQANSRTISTSSKLQKEALRLQ